MPAPEELADAFAAAWTGKVEAAFADCCADGVHYEDPFCVEPLEGPAAIGRHARRLWAGFPDLRVDPAGQQLGDGRFLAAPVKLAGTNTAELEGLPPTRKFVVVPAILYCEVADGQLTRVRAFCDRWDAALQLGLVPKPGTLGAKALLAMRGFGLTSRR